jgi:putative membrane-bound dehydrogenase-like protein
MSAAASPTMNLKSFRCFCVVFAAFVCSADCHAQKQVLHTATEPLPPLDAARTMGVPEGFRVTLFAGEPDVMQPIGFCIDDRGRLWVAEAYNYPTHGTKPGDRIVILEDSDGDGRHDRRTIFCEGLNYVTGIEVGFGGAWVMSPPCMYFIPDRDHDDVPDSQPQVLLDGFGNHANAHNLANGFAWGPDGWLYGTHGRTNWSMIGKPGADPTQRRRFDGGVYRYHPVLHIWEPYADGTTNPWGIDWNDYGDAFVCNCVNPHLFQVIQGAHYEPWRSRESSRYAYQRIDTIADHLHFVGLSNVRNGFGSPAEDRAGGGHAHCGTMIYLGDNFPATYRNQLFTNNIHGRRINHDLLRRAGSGYVASHGPDLMRSADPWFMGVTLGYGPGGEVYASDWSDTGECHSTRDTRRNTGRIYRLTYLTTDLQPVNLGSMTDEQLVALQLHENDWFVRHARRILQERSAAGGEMAAVHTTLREMLADQTSTPKRLRALWALKVTDGLSDDLLLGLLDHEDEYVRGWAICLSCEDREPSSEALAAMLELASQDPAPRVRLALASALQRLQPESRWPLAEALAARGEDATDQNLPLMIWYGIEPLIDDDLQRYASLGSNAAIARVRENIARRIASSPQSPQGLELLLSQIATDDRADSHSDLLAGILLGLEGQRQVEMPSAWPAAYKQLAHDDDLTLHHQAMQLALIFRDRDAISSLERIAVDRNAASELRTMAIEGLAASRADGFAVELLGLLDDVAVRSAALRGLSRFNAEQTAEVILSRYADFTSQEKQLGLQTLASRVTWAKGLLDAMESGGVPTSDVSAFTARQLRSLGDDDVNSRFQHVWGNVRESARDSAKRIESLRRTLTAEVLGGADLSRGEELFKKHCANCHRFFDQGGKIGPDLTGAQRTNLDYLLENVVDPSASVAQEYRMQVVQTVDGRIMTGLVESEGERSITVVNADDRFVIPLGDIEQRTKSEVSVMPNGLLEPLSDREIRDLFGYLQR